MVGKNVQILTNINVNNGGLFYRNGSRKFDVAVVGFSEYVTAAEYASYKNFVTNGGELIKVSADNFMVQVKYFREPISLRWSKAMVGSSTERQLGGGHMRGGTRGTKIGSGVTTASGIRKLLVPRSDCEHE